MTTNAEIVSRVLNGLKLLNKDELISKRYILNIAEKNAEFLISHKLRDKSLFRETNVYSSVNCLELEKKDVYTCGVVEFHSCNKVMRSKKKLPDLIFSRYGAGLRQVTPIDFMSDEEFYPATLVQFKRNRRRVRVQEDSKNYYIKDNYVYIPESDVRAISLELIVVNTFKLSEIDSEFTKGCKSAWEYEFKCPDKLSDTVIQKTIQEVAVGRGIPEDENPNLSSNLKSRT
jgi:hypothetical protein